MDPPGVFLASHFRGREHCRAVAVAQPGSEFGRVLPENQIRSEILPEAGAVAVSSHRSNVRHFHNLR